MKLDFLTGDDVVTIAKKLLGLTLYTTFQGKRTAGLICETEAYSYREKGCHAYNNKRTPRTETMFKEGGHLYIYLCYGIHHLINIVTHKEGVAEAVLIRAIQPTEGIDIMKERRGKQTLKGLTDGPGKLSQALGITTAQNNLYLGQSIGLDKGVQPKKIACSPRIGIDYAQEDAALPWRFYTSN